MAIAFSGGPAHLWVGIDNQTNKKPIYLGTGKGRPKIRINRKWHPLMNDIGGDEPFDWSYMGSSALIAYQLTRWNEGAFQRLAATPNVYRFGNFDGLEANGDLGSLMVTENLAFPVWVAQPYGTKAGYAAQGHHRGWHFFACLFMGPDDLERGTAPAEDHIVFYATRVYVPANGSFLLYDHNLNGVPNPD